MNVLIIEDDEQKLNHIVNFVNSAFENVTVVQSKSFVSGRKSILSDVFDLLLLDMTLPVYDVSPNETGYETLFFAGRDIMREMVRKEIKCATIVVTQFEQFGEDHDRTTLEELKLKLNEQFSENYLGTVYYHPSQDDWKGEIIRLLPDEFRP